MPRRSRVENAPWVAEKEFKWQCPACRREITCRGDTQCASRILVHLASHDMALPLLAKCITEIEHRIRELYSGEFKL